MTQKRHQEGRQNVNRKNVDFVFFLMKFHENIVFYRVLWASGADSIVFYNEFSRPESRKNQEECGPNLKKLCFFVFFYVPVENADLQF